MNARRDIPAAFNKVADVIEPLLIRLGRAAPGAELVIIRDEVTGALDGAGLTWSDLAARIAAPSPTAPQATSTIPPEMPLRAAPATPPASPKESFTNEQLLEFGYRQHGLGYGYEGASHPDTDPEKPKE